MSIIQMTVRYSDPHSNSRQFLSAIWILDLKWLKTSVRFLDKYLNLYFFEQNQLLTNWILDQSGIVIPTVVLSFEIFTTKIWNLKNMLSNGDTIFVVVVVQQMTLIASKSSIITNLLLHAILLYPLSFSRIQRKTTIQLWNFNCSMLKH